MNQTHATPRTVRPRLASRTLFREAFQCFADFSTTLLDAIYTFLLIDAPGWVSQQEERLATRLFADESWENTTKPEQPGSNVYTTPSYVPEHFYDEDGRWDAAPDWVMWVALGVCLTVAGWLFYLWPELMIGIVALVCIGLLYLAFRK